MPLLGHAFVGLATGMAVAPFPSERPPATPRERAAEALWLPATVALAYVPDLVTQLGLLLGMPRAGLLAHSLLFAIALAAPLTALGALAGGLPAGRLLAVVLGSVVLHDVLDVAQSTDRQPWWPLSSGAVRLPLALIPADPRWEALAFAAGFAVFLAALIALRRARGRRPARRFAPTWPGRALIVALVAAAALTHHLRDLREHRLDEARDLLEGRHPAEALAALDEAERWPSTAKPGRADHLRGEAWLGLGDRARAEHHFRRSYEADPDFFWLLADLGAFYASVDAPASERRRLAAPYLERLRRDFAGHGAQPAALARIERHLVEPPRGR